MVRRKSRSQYSVDEIDQIRGLLLEREHRGGRPLDVYRRLHEFGFYASHFLVDEGMAAPLLAADLDELIERRAIEIVEESRCSVCGHSSTDHQMFAKQPRQTRGESYIDPEGGFCADCAECREDDESFSDYTSRRGRRVPTVERDEDRAVLGVEDWAKGGFHIDPHQPW